MPLESQAEFAAYHGVSRKTVTQWKSEGRLAMVGSKVDREASDVLLSDARLGRFRPDARQKTDVSAGTDADTQSLRSASQTDFPIPDVVDAGTIRDFLAQLLDGNFATQSQAERVKENALAGVRALELQHKAGALVEMAVAERTLFETFRGIRDAWMNWPARIGPLLAADLDLPADRVTEALTRYVHDHLADLGEPGGSFGES